MTQIADRLPLSQYRVFESDAPDEVAGFLAERHFDLRITASPRCGKLNTRINAAYLPGIYFSALAYDGFVEVATRPERGDYALQVPLSGTFEAVTSGIPLPTGSGQAMIGSRREQLIRSVPGCVRLAVSIDPDTLLRQLSALIHDAVDQPLVFSAVVKPAAPQQSDLTNVLRWALTELERSPSLLHNRLAAIQFQQFLLTVLLLQHDNNYTRRLQAPNDNIICVRGLKRTTDYIEANADLPITLSDLVAVSGIAGRTLYKHFRLSKGTSPMAYLRRVRLRKARDELLDDNGAKTVTEVATRWGFNHLGHFSADYHRCFGETPSSTLRRR